MGILMPKCWYSEQGDSDLSNHYENLAKYSYHFSCGFAGLCCVGSVGLLSGTVFWVRKMTFSNEASGLKADALNLKMVFGHIFLLFA
jgi:hypothetical protein